MPVEQKIRHYLWLMAAPLEKYATARGKKEIIEYFGEVFSSKTDQ